EYSKYGHGVIDSFMIIPLCVKGSAWDIMNCKERAYVSLKRKTAYIRLRINCEEFLAADKRRREEIVMDTVRRSVDILVEKTHGKFDGA
ncbi:MAG: hypothetical protein RR296_12480, partial [Clostridia bacterium]